MALNLSTSSGSAGSVPDEPRAATPDPEGPRLLGSGIRVCPLGRRQSGRRASSGLPLRYCAAAGDTEFMDAPGRKDAGVPEVGGTANARGSPAARTALLYTQSRAPGSGRSGYPGSQSQRHLGGSKHPDTVGLVGQQATPPYCPPPWDSTHPPNLTAQAPASPEGPLSETNGSEPKKSRPLLPLSEALKTLVLDDTSNCRRRTFSRSRSLISLPCHSSSTAVEVPLFWVLHLGFVMPVEGSNLRNLL